MSSPWYRPPPILARAGAPVDARRHFHASARRLLAGETLWIRDHYRTGIRVIEALVSALRPPLHTADHADKQRYREAYRDHAFRLLTPIQGGRIALPGAPSIGFLDELYPELDAFWLPFPEVRSLSHAWHQYEAGVHFAVLGHRLHPFYGTYLPKRADHLELFATWLSGWKGPRRTAIDVGTGSGVLALLLAKAGVPHVFATDLSPNACESVRRELVRRRRPLPIEVVEADLFAETPSSADLIVFNPPWTRGPVQNLLDRALHYDDDGLFLRFFDQAAARLTPEGRVVLVFSNVTQLVQPDAPHPILAELGRGRFELVNKLTRRIKPPADGPHRAPTNQGAGGGVGARPHLVHGDLSDLCTGPHARCGRAERRVRIRLAARRHLREAPSSRWDSRPGRHGRRLRWDAARQ